MSHPFDFFVTTTLGRVLGACAGVVMMVGGLLLLAGDRWTGGAAILVVGVLVLGGLSMAAVGKRSG
jgi:hypothetical protein